jgi:MFS family permease
MGVFQNRWWVVLASASGLMVGGGAINVFAFGVFMKPVTESLGIDRGVFSTGIAISALLNALACPLVGWLIDRFGARRVMIPGILLCALATASYGLLQASPLVIMVTFAVAGFVFGVQTPIAYATVTSQWFDRQRGLALGLAMAGVGLGVALIPQIASVLIAKYGWREAFVGLGICVLAFAFVPVALFIREPPGFLRSAERRAGAGTQPAVPGIEIGEALRGSWQFYALTVAFFLAIVAINGTISHVVALLTDRGIPLQVATGALSASGLAIICGRVLSGWCLDRFWGPYVAVVFFVIPMIGIGLLDSGAGGAVPVVGAALCGLGIGAEVDLMAFFVSRYFGLRDYGKVYGTMFAVFSFGVGVGPAISGWVFVRFHSYDPVFVFYEVLLGITCVLFLRLGPYPYPPRSELLGAAEDRRLPA